MRARGSDLVGFWRAFIQRAESGDGSYGADTCREQLTSVAPMLATQVERFVTVGVGDPLPAIKRLLEAGNVASEVVDGQLRVIIAPKA